MTEYIVPECGDCLHASLCEMLPLSEFNRENPAYCKAFKSASDVVEVVRCKNCQHSDFVNCTLWCTLHDVRMDDNDFCSFGAKMGGKGEHDD